MGFTFNGKHSKEFGLYFKTDEIPYVATKRSSSVTVQGKDGQYIYEDGYDNILITLAATVISGSVLTRRKAARKIAAWLSGTGVLVFDYEKDIEYKVVKIPSEILSSMEWSADELEIAFECKPHQKQTYYNDKITWGEATTPWGEMNIPWGGYQRTFDVENGDEINVVNAGTYKAMPLIKLTGIATNLSIGPMDILEVQEGVEVIIDCEEKVVYRTLGASISNYYYNFDGDFIELIPGENRFNISGTITNLKIEFDYKNTYL